VPFKFNSRHHTKESAAAALATLSEVFPTQPLAVVVAMVGGCTAVLNSADPQRLKAPGFNPAAYKVKLWFQSLPFEFNSYRYTAAADKDHEGFLREVMAAGPAAVVGLYKLNPVDP
jgi:hypothetical protein